MELFIVIAVTHFIALLSPGPDFFLILTTLIKSGKHAAVRVCSGIAFGNAVILLIVFFSLTALEEISSFLMQLLKWAGAIYLLYLTFLCFRYTNLKSNFQIDIQNNIAISPLKYFQKGMQSSLLNPKNTMFYSSLVLLVSEKYNLMQKLGISVWMVIVVLIWNLFLINILSHQHSIHILQKQAKWVYYGSGLMFFIFALLLFFLL